jgi:hypothetical protein
MTCEIALTIVLNVESVPGFEKIMVFGQHMWISLWCPSRE